MFFIILSSIIIFSPTAKDFVSYPSAYPWHTRLCLVNFSISFFFRHFPYELKSNSWYCILNVWGINTEGGFYPHHMIMTLLIKQCIMNIKNSKKYHDEPYHCFKFDSFPCNTMNFAWTFFLNTKSKKVIFVGFLSWSSCFFPPPDFCKHTHMLFWQ